MTLLYGVRSKFQAHWATSSLHCKRCICKTRGCCCSCCLASKHLIRSGMRQDVHHLQTAVPAQRAPVHCTSVIGWDHCHHPRHQKTLLYGVVQISSSYRPCTANAAYAKPEVVVVAVVLPASTSSGEACDKMYIICRLLYQPSVPLHSCPSMPQKPQKAHRLESLSCHAR